MLGAMLIAQRVHGVTPANAAVLVEAAIQRATERFTTKSQGAAR